MSTFIYISIISIESAQRHTLRCSAYGPAQSSLVKFGQEFAFLAVSGQVRRIVRFHVEFGSQVRQVLIFHVLYFNGAPFWVDIRYW